MEVFGAWIKLSDTAKLAPIQQPEVKEEAAEEAEEAGEEVEAAEAEAEEVEEEAEDGDAEARGAREADARAKQRGGKQSARKSFGGKSGAKSGGKAGGKAGGTPNRSGAAGGERPHASYTVETRKLLQALREAAAALPPGATVLAWEEDGSRAV